MIVYAFGYCHTYGVTGAKFDDLKKFIKQNYEYTYLTNAGEFREAISRLRAEVRALNSRRKNLAEIEMTTTRDGGTMYVGFKRKDSKASTLYFSTQILRPMKEKGGRV